MKEEFPKLYLYLFKKKKDKILKNTVIPVSPFFKNAHIARGYILKFALSMEKIRLKRKRILTFRINFGFVKMVDESYDLHKHDIF